MRTMKTEKENFSTVTLIDLFTNMARTISRFAGSPFAFFLALISILIWIVLGPYYKYSDTWQLIINTGTTILTFLMVFIIQNAQNRDSRAIELKLDELLNKTPDKDSNKYIQIEDLSEEEIESLSEKFDYLKPSKKNKKV